MMRIVVVALACVSAVTAHSWLGCADYRGPVDYYDDSQCHAYPRNWQTARSGALTQIDKGYQLGADTGYNYQATETQACQLPIKSPIDAAYTTSYPKAVYEQGKTYCLAWPMKNHGSGTCTNQYIPDTSMKLFRSNVNVAADPTQTAFKLNPVTTNFGTHSNGQIDCLGFQRAPKFCDNTDRAMATGCFSVPATQAVGTYVYQWYWIFNENTAPYTTCWDAQVVAAGTGRGAGGVTGADSIVDNLGGSSTSVCKNNWATANAASTAVTPSSPTVATSTGTASTPTTPSTDETVVLNGDSIRVTRAPATIPTTATSFDVTVVYAATGARVITVDILDSTGKWYGKGTASVTATSAGTTTVTCTVNILQVHGAPVAGNAYILRAWIVSKEIFDANNQPWTQEMDREDVAVVAAASAAIYYSTGTVTVKLPSSTGAGLSGNGASSSASAGAATALLLAGAAAVAAVAAL